MRLQKFGLAEGGCMTNLANAIFLFSKTAETFVVFRCLVTSQSCHQPGKGHRCGHDLRDYSSPQKIDVK
ncbi:hypothetical protein RT717_02245 [Imperialibacter roseus]|uniref:Uncharacterized protein n=1 Tax=Imperialibacter roseus TaxID=1324217 RepID=A0ABZ0IRT1_9BACT|nr:hypothetical protein [Imperialibacter roseus]WOK07441.1 hypothetical protein RT717_02245 [Imperialibacter roseus]